MIYSDDVLGVPLSVQLLTLYGGQNNVLCIIIVDPFYLSYLFMGCMKLIDHTKRHFVGKNQSEICLLYSPYQKNLRQNVQEKCSLYRGFELLSCIAQTNSRSL